MPAPDVRYPSIDALRAFEAAARLGSFERAAEELHVTASAVSKRISTLEELLGTALLSRSAKALALTAAGKEYLQQVGAALGLLAAVPLHRRDVQRQQRLRVRATPTFARQILVPQLESFTANHGHIELEVVLSIPFLDSAGPQADVEVRTADLRQLPEGASPLMRDVVVPVAAPGLLARLPPLRRPSDLSAAPLLRTPLEPWTPWFQAAGLDWPEPTQGPKLVDLGLTLEAAVSGQGVALARPTLARHWLGSGTLRPLFDITAVPRQQYVLLKHGASEAADAFCEWLTAHCERSAAEALALLQARLSGAA
ncbi:LysR substrate-binding domain-containing protein [Ideonella sp. BN130291]|uniref:LysR substrate-binding domain-containing protein n=1 Tax=Ideonella sp. BN130291 TaxID=3112940 RepID=UPI002E263EEA|nr:LysR substrate-binding domain-containing protein [Ideonella sp. BN130291]